MDDVFRALADANRRELLDRLFARNGQTLNELCDRLAEAGASMTRQAVSKHLAILEDANLVATVRRGREKLHYLNPVPIHDRVGLEYGLGCRRHQSNRTRGSSVACAMSASR